MANHVNVDINANVQGYVDGINQAKQATADYTTETKKVQDNVGNFRKEFAAAKKDVMNLAQAYRNLSNEEKNSQFGKEMAKQLQAAKEKAAEMTDLMSDMQAELKNMASDTSTLDVLSEGMGVLANTASTAAGAIAWVTGSEEDAKKAVVAFTTATSALNAVTKIQKMLQGQSATMIAVNKVQTLAAAAAENVKTAATGKGIIATKAATVAQGAFNAVAKANPYVLLATAIIGVATALWAFASGSDEATEKTNELTTAEENAKKAHETYSQSLSSEFAKLMTSYTKLKAEWSNLANDTAKQKWINDHKSELKSLGTEINNVKDAEGYFNKNTNEVVKAFQRRAQAAAITAKMTELYRQKMDLIDKYNQWKETDGVKAGEKVYGEPGVVTGDANGKTYNGGKYYMDKGVLKYTEQGADAANKATKAYREMNSAFLANERELDKCTKQFTSLVDVQNNVNTSTNNNTKNVQVHTDTVKHEIDTYKEAISEYDKLTKEKAELEQLMNEGRVDTQFLEGFKQEISEYDTKIQDLVDKWHIKPAPIKIEAKVDKLSVDDVLNGKISKSISGYSEAISMLQNALKQMNPEESAANWDTYIDKIQEYKKALSGLEESYDEAMLTPMDKAVDHFEKASEKAENVGSTLSSLGDVANAVGQAFKAAGDETTAAMMEMLTATLDMTAQIIPQIMKLIGAKQAEAMAEGTASAAKLPYPANLGAIASIIATVLSTFATIYAAAQKFDSGGIVGGSSYHGDKILTRVESGEMILNRHQQKNLFDLLDGTKMPQSGGTNVTVTGVIRGTDIMLVQKNTNKVLRRTGTNLNI
jgi:hypothetical protein